MDADAIARSAARPDRPGLRRAFEVAFWVVVTLLNGIANSITVLIDVRRADLDYAAWKPVVWEFSSGLVFLALVPALVWFTRRFPIHLDTWRRQLPWHLLASVAFSALHVAGMVALRKLVYASQGETYDFSPWVREFFYEYLKDARSYLTMVATIEAYRFIRRRLKGEASVLAAADDEPGPPADAVERPERFLVRKLGREFLIAASDIEWLQAAGNYVNLNVRGHEYPLRSTVAAIEGRLDPALFARVHRSYIVNLDRLEQIEPLESGDARLRLRDGTWLPCSRSYREALRARLAPA